MSRGELRLPPVPFVLLLPLRPRLLTSRSAHVTEQCDAADGDTDEIDERGDATVVIPATIDPPLAKDDERRRTRAKNELDIEFDREWVPALLPASET